MNYLPKLIQILLTIAAIQGLSCAQHNPNVMKQNFAIDCCQCCDDDGNNCKCCLCG